MNTKFHIIPTTMRPTIGTKRSFHCSSKRPVWYLAATVAGTVVYIGTRYILRAQERVRRKREGLPIDEEDLQSYSNEISRHHHQINRIVGLDFGTLNVRVASSMGSLTQQKPMIRVIESAEGHRSIPAIVSVDHGNATVGQLAKASLGRKNNVAAIAPHLLLGYDEQDSELLEFMKKLPCPLVKKGQYKIVLDEEEYTPEWATEVLLEHMQKNVQRTLSQEFKETLFTILTVPANATQKRRQALERAAKNAGFQVLSVVEDPIAALYGAERELPKPLDTGIYAVVDMGGLVSSVSLVEKSNNSMKVVATISSRKLSGYVLDQSIFAYVIEKFKKQYKIDLSIDPMASFRVLEAVEAAKIELSSRKSTDINLPFITADQNGAKHLVQKLSMIDIARLCENPLQEMLHQCTDELFHQNGGSIRKQKIKQLLLIGGGMRIPHVSHTFEHFFDQKAIQIPKGQPEEIIVKGSIQYARDHFIN